MDEIRYRSEWLYDYARANIKDEDVFPILVPSYNRPNCRICEEFLLEEPNLPIVLCIRREQQEMYSRWVGKCGIMLLDNVYDIASTRREIIRQASKYYSNVFMLDDDINELEYLIPSYTSGGKLSMRSSKLYYKRKPKALDIFKMWMVLLQDADPMLTISSLAYRPESWHMKNCNAEIYDYNHGACIQCIHLNLANLGYMGITYKDHSVVGNEDYALQFDTMSAGLKTCVFRDLMYGCPAVNCGTGGNENALGISDGNERYKYYVSCAKAYYRDHPGIKYSKSKTGLESVKFNWKYWRSK